MVVDCRVERSSVVTLISMVWNLIKYFNTETKIFKLMRKYVSSIGPEIPSYL